MLEYLDKINHWTENSIQFALIRVISTWGSSPRPVGSIMLVAENGEMAGSVSGGCIENQVAKTAFEVLKSGESRLLSYGVTNEDAWTAGLACGGNVEVFIQRMDAASAVWTSLIQWLESNRSCVLVTHLVDGDCFLVTSDHTIGKVEAGTEELARKALKDRTHKKTEAQFLQVFPRKSQLFIVGAAHLSADLVMYGHQLGFETIVIDPREVFTAKTDFPVPPDRVFTAYPSEVLGQFDLDPYSYFAILSHDPKIDDNALEILLRSEVAYIGALGSKKTHAKRVARLQEKGFTEVEIDRIYAPIGENINARSAREIALSVISQIVKVKNQHK